MTPYATFPLIHVVDDDIGVRAALALLITSVGLRVQTWVHAQAFVAGFDRDAIGLCQPRRSR